jgi:uncharacterized protein DUF2188
LVRLFLGHFSLSYRVVDESSRDGLLFVQFVPRIQPIGVHMAPKNIHVVPTESGWAVKQEGNPMPLSQHQTQAAALQAGRPVAQMLGGETGRFATRTALGQTPSLLATAATEPI